MLDGLKPARREHVFDLVAAAGFDTTDWVDSSNDPRGYKANPKYAYQWAFVEPGKVVIFNLWYRTMVERDGQVVSSGNYRDDAVYHSRPGGKSAWRKRAYGLDDALKTAVRDNLPIRVIINDGVMRNRDDPEQKPAKVYARVLDPEPWAISAYDWKTGAYTLARGILQKQFIDQFDVDQADKMSPQRREVIVTSFRRDPQIRQIALHRANGHCEYCGDAGFETSSGAIYLETHHIQPLGEGGADVIENVIALCANHHRQAHFGALRDKLKSELHTRLSTARNA